MISNGERDTLFTFANAYDQKLTGLRLFGELWRFDDKFVGLAAEVFIINNFIHVRTFFL